jgi:hypothetical protein
MAAEMSRRDAADIFIANMQRVKESLRVLEEFAKLFDASFALKFQRLRFKTYAVEKDAVAGLCVLRDRGRRIKMSSPGFKSVTKPPASKPWFSRRHK